MTLDDLRSHSELLAPHGCAKSRAVLELFACLAQRDELIAGLTADYNAMVGGVRVLEAIVETHQEVIAEKDRLIAGLSDRVEKQAELLSKRAEKTP